MSTPLGRNYWKLWTASVISNFGDGVAIIAYPWLASAVTRNPVQIALVAVATRLPWLVFTLPAGVITDRVDRRKLVAWMDVARFLMTAGVAIAVLATQDQLATADEIAAGTAALPEASTFLLVMIYAAALLLGAAEVLRDNSAQTLMPAIVEEENLERANGRLWGAEMIMNSFVGPPLGGFLLAIAFALPFFVDAGTFAVAAALVFMISGNFRAKRAAPGPEAKASFLGEMKEGVRWLWQHPLFRPMAISLGVTNAMFSLAWATFVLFAQEILGLGATGFGVLMTAGAAGGVLGSFLSPGISKRIGQGPSLFLTLGVCAFTLTVTGLASSGLVVWVMFALEALVSVLWNVITVSLRQALIPDHLLGRVNSVYRFFGWGMMPIGAVLGGVIVAVAEPLAGREWALRAPFIFAALVHVALLFYAVPNLNTGRIEAARATAHTQEAGVESVEG
ncbi:MAG TPA: MFS transporter [Acidimicrobiia bacterium]|nr:MFS transporter [Acidimicrobiia bacterium]